MSKKDENLIKFQNILDRYQAYAQAKLSEDKAETVYDYLELAENASTKKTALKYVKKALELEPDNLDAGMMNINLTATSAQSVIDKYRKMLDKATKSLENQGYFSEDTIGDFWLILETRPYMRLRMEYIHNLILASKFRLAIAECEDMLRLCNNDNVGARFTLMHLYAYFEDEQAALALLKKYHNEKSTQLLLPMSLLYFKLDNLPKATRYLKELNEVNDGTYDFVKAMLEGDIGDYFDELSAFGYRPFTIEEFIVELQENSFLLMAVPVYYDWAVRKLKTMK